MQILEEKHELYFHLQQQRLIELIRQGKAEEALEFAQDTLAPQGEENPEFLEELGELSTFTRLVCSSAPSPTRVSWPSGLALDTRAPRKAQGRSALL